MLRAVASEGFYEAAAVILTRSSTDSTPRTWGLQLRERIGFKRAAVAVARSFRSEHEGCAAERVETKHRKRYERPTEPRIWCGRPTHRA